MGNYLEKDFGKGKSSARKKKVYLMDFWTRRSVMILRSLVRDARNDRERNSRSLLIKGPAEFQGGDIGFAFKELAEGLGMFETQFIGDFANRKLGCRQPFLSLFD